MTLTLSRFDYFEHLVFTRIIFQPKPFKWMLDVVWLNLVELSKQKTFREILSSVTSTEKEWKKWFDTDAPEEEDIPCGYHNSLDVFRKLLLIRSWCPDRTLSQARKYIFEDQLLRYQGVGVPGSIRLHPCVTVLS